MTEGHTLDTKKHEKREAVFSELLMRLISAIILAALVLLLTSMGGGAFFLLVVIGALILSWEWGNLTGLRVYAFMNLVTIAVLAALCLAAFHEPMRGLGVLGASLPLILWAGRGTLSPLSALGPFYIGVPALSLIWLRDDPVYGFAALLFLFLIVWTADSAAYVSGRLIGGAKLAPQISPKKTWSGLIGGVAASTFMAVVFALFYGLASPLIVALIAMGIAVVSQLGDLLESALKRHFGIKDTSGLIPGHGGLFDRVDGLLFAVVAAALIGLLKDWQAPARALLIWP